MLPPLLRYSASLVSAFALSFPLSLMAAENPPEPSPYRSSGSFRITLFNNTSIQLYGLKDVDISNSRTGSTPVCVASNVDEYRMSMTSSTNFQLRQQSGNGVGYTLTLKKDNTKVTSAVWGTGNGNLKSGTYAPNPIRRDIELSESNPIQSTCPTSAHQIEVSIPDTSGKPEGAYSDTVTVTVAPI